MAYIEVIPAYGRDYKNQKDVKADWNADKDFQIVDYGPDHGRYINKSQAVEAHLSVIVRYSKLMKVVQVQK